MKIKMWSLVNTKKDFIVKISDEDGYTTIGFDTKKDLMGSISILGPELDEEIRKIEFEV